MRRLLHLIFGWDYVNVAQYGIFRIRVNQDGLAYVMLPRRYNIRLNVTAMAIWHVFFIHGTIYDYFTEEEVEKIYGTTNRQ